MSNNRESFTSEAFVGPTHKTSATLPKTIQSAEKDPGRSLRGTGTWPCSLLLAPMPNSLPYVPEWQLYGLRDLARGRYCPTTNDKMENTTSTQIDNRRDAATRQPPTLDTHDTDQNGVRATVSSKIRRAPGVRPNRCQPPTLDTRRPEISRERGRDARFTADPLRCQGCQGGILYYRVACTHTGAHALMSRKMKLPLDTLDTVAVGVGNRPLSPSLCGLARQERQPPTLDSQGGTLDIANACQDCGGVLT